MDIDLTSRDSNGATSLMHATNGSLDVFKFVLDRRTPDEFVNALANDCRCPVYSVISAFDYAVIDSCSKLRCLIARGAKLRRPVPNYVGYQDSDERLKSDFNRKNTGHTFEEFVKDILECHTRSGKIVVRILGKVLG